MSATQRARPDRWPFSLHNSGSPDEQAPSPHDDQNHELVFLCPTADQLYDTMNNVGDSALHGARHELRRRSPRNSQFHLGHAVAFSISGEQSGINIIRHERSSGGMVLGLASSMSPIATATASFPTPSTALSTAAAGTKLSSATSETLGSTGALSTPSTGTDVDKAT
ncbi:uncharacterized protein THITE_2083705 [Thermothielavioides terrestris NRRL 8126]|uniref:Uncharacterized protein n=1 Tax=Thermothielavioides terrestris (strain ATCC 38088 / NRRL 8126) TaxID=578455 RepID=G2QW14_THETT|nr:uncharacterized protein THITE_2083705 [Thermothielavioides terrestris NRRL 8126]AEO62185.1 hypothetical protein THITE_2083705 [Thermothielavioides terrestris NRRL 8126]